MREAVDLDLPVPPPIRAIDWATVDTRGNRRTLRKCRIFGELN